MSKAGKGKKAHSEGEERAEPDPATTELAKEGKTKVHEIKSSITLEALRIIHETMPQKVFFGRLCRIERTVMKGRFYLQILELTKELADNEYFRYPSPDDAQFEVQWGCHNFFSSIANFVRLSMDVS